MDRADFGRHGIAYTVSDASATALYEALEPRLNGRRVVLLDVPQVEQQFLGLVWRGGKIDHPPGEHDDFANAVAGTVSLLAGDDAVPHIYGLNVSAAPPPEPEPVTVEQAAEREQRQRDLERRQAHELLWGDRGWRT